MTINRQTTNELIREMTRAKNILTELHDTMIEENYWPDCTDLSYGLAMQLRELIKEIDLQTEKVEYMNGGDTNAQETLENHQEAPTTACNGLGKGPDTIRQANTQQGAVATRIAPTPCTH